MALETQIGPLSTPEYLLAQTIANATHFLTFSGEATPAEALDRIYFGALPIPAAGAESYTKTDLSNYRPFAVVMMNAFDGLRMRRRATGWHYENGGTLVAYFSRDTPEGETLEEADRSWKNTIGKLLKQTTEADPFVGILDQADTADRLTISGMRINEIGRADPDEITARNDYQYCSIIFEWGIDQ